MPNQTETPENSVVAYLREIRASALPLTEQQMQSAADFAQILYRENKIQNLTRIEGPKEFVDGHLSDVVELLSLPTLGNRVLDIGSGSGVPGLLAAAINAESERVWFLCEAEKNKAEYLQRAKEELGLKRVSVFHKRAEEIVGVLKPDSVIARAVGTVEKLAGWIANCSTWNNLILFKSKGWESEWSDAQKSRFGKKLTVIHMHEYSSGDKVRRLITLKRK
jgi:16S rRNA (guanine527-N7)-methyltransferase